MATAGAAVWWLIELFWDLLRKFIDWLRSWFGNPDDDGPDNGEPPDLPHQGGCTMQLSLSSSSTSLT